MQVSGRDKVIFKNLAALEQAGEKGFSTYHSGDTKAGKVQIRQCFLESTRQINDIQDPELRKQAKLLLGAASKAIQAYLKNPNDVTGSILKIDVDSYKSFLENPKGT